MAFCKFSIDMIANNTTAVDNIFINNYLPYADPMYVKVYLYGLYKCQAGDANDNTLENFANELRLSQEQVAKAFTYWHEQGLIQFLNIVPFEVRYLPISDVINNTKKYNIKKFASFNAKAQEILSGRMITPNEYREYYDIIERFHMEKDALLMIINYCVNIKDNAVGYAYITTIAKDWANQKITTTKQVEARLLDFETFRTGKDEIKKALGINSPLSLDEHMLYKKWKDQGFEDVALKHVAKKAKAKKAPSFAYMDALLQKYFANKLFSINEIDLYDEERAMAKEISKVITKNLGLYYENLDPVIDNYVWNWISLSFSKKMLEKISNYCFKTGIRTLEGMNSEIEKLFKNGILSEKSFDDFQKETLGLDKKIKNILETLGLSRKVNQFDRDKYHVWKEIWKFSDELIEYACSLSVGKGNPISYLSEILTAYHDKNITRVEEAKQAMDIIGSKDKKSNFANQRKLAKEDSRKLAVNIEEIEI